MGIQLLRNFQCRQRLGLLPTQFALPSAALLSEERAAALLAHQAFGYTTSSDEGGSCSNATAEGILRDGLAGSRDSAMVADLEARRAVLFPQLEELKAALAEEQLKTKEVGDMIQGRQQDMNSVVDEHATLSRDLSETKSRVLELARETDRLHAALQARGEAAGAMGDNDSTHQKLPGACEPGPTSADMAAARARHTARARLALHQVHLLRLSRENEQLRQRHDDALHVTAAAYPRGTGTVF